MSRSRPPSGGLRPSRSASTITTESENERKHEQFAAAEAFEVLRQEQATAASLAILQKSSTTRLDDQTAQDVTTRLDEHQSQAALRASHETVQLDDEKEQDRAFELLERSVVALSERLLRLAHVCVEKARRSTEIAMWHSELSKGVAGQTVMGLKSVRDELAQLQSTLVDQKQAILLEGAWLTAGILPKVTEKECRKTTTVAGIGEEYQENCEDHFGNKPRHSKTPSPTTETNRMCDQKQEECTGADHFQLSVASLTPASCPADTRNEVATLFEHLPSPEAEKLLTALAANERLKYHLVQHVMGDHENASVSDAVEDMVQSLTSESSILLEVT